MLWFCLALLPQVYRVDLFGVWCMKPWICLLYETVIGSQQFMEEPQYKGLFKFVLNYLKKKKLAA